MAFRNRMAVSRLKYLKRDRPVQELNSAMLEDSDRIKNTVAASICLGSSFSELNKMKQNLYRFKFLHLLKRDGNSNLTARSTSPFIYKSNLYGGLYGGGKYGNRSTTGTASGASISGGRTGNSRVDIVSSKISAGSSGGGGGGGYDGGTRARDHIINPGDKGSESVSGANRRLGDVAYRKSDHIGENNNFDGVASTNAPDASIADGAFGVFNGKVDQNANLDGNFEEEEEHLRYAGKLG